MVEVIIAMVVVTLVTITASSLFVTSTHTTQKAINKSQAQHFAEDAFVCFRAAETADQFSAAMELRGGYSEHAVTDGNKYTYTLSGSGFNAVAYVTYPAEGRATFRIEITDGDALIASIPEFKKGA